MRTTYFSIAIMVIALLLAGSAGVLHVGMTTEGGGAMAPCPVMGDGAICDMNPLEHIAAWQSAFAASLTQGRDFALLLLVFAIVLAVGLWRPLYTKRALQVLHIWRYRVRKEYRIVSPLQEAFSNGILNPKVF